MNKAILLVEDNPDEELLMLRALKKNNIKNKIVIARDGSEALRIIAQDEQFQVIMLDLNLPVVSGMEVLKTIRENNDLYSTPVVILSSSREESDMTNSYRLGANSYVTKPVDYEEFIDTVNNLGRYWLSVNQLPAYN
ncbi:two-component system response regulator [Desulfuribacillus stibiiarsenatis]|uniref:Two-component system response regulator n=1 Tax=Desulfuribacillus stibiiarsenatis TaxID=1390249 RepID=A0A1E5L3B8_9FIRM|nr:response regulator [Desulfuribacillus stibiiarsenatis]OEH84429.1 two-component system response regulator [Desulfuribacillus stibiiarsenatis]